MKGPLATFQLQRQEDGSLALSVLECAGLKAELPASDVPVRTRALAFLAEALSPPPMTLLHVSPARPIDEYHEDLGNVLWWRFPIEEPPYCGSTLDCGFPDDVTHFTPLGELPIEPTRQPRQVPPELGFVESCDGGPGRESIKKSHRGEGLNFVD